MPHLSNHIDQDDLDNLKKGSEEAFERIFKRYWYTLYKTALGKTQSHEEAEEIVQTILFTLWEKRERLAITNLSCYLQTAVRNNILNSIRSKITQRKYWDYYKHFVPSENETTEQSVVYQDLNQAVEAAVNRLPEKSRKIFRLNRFEGRSISEIANLLKVSEKAIEYHLTKSLKELKIHLKDYILFLATFLMLK
jgi:RNA polymerase sigma-70 factor (ECF subfamily)